MTCGTFNRLWRQFCAISNPGAACDQLLITACGSCRLNLAIALGVAKPTLPQNWLTVEDLTNLLNLA
jgi:Fe-S oxidoreductase